MTAPSQLREVVEQHLGALVRRPATLLVALSGGLDSVVLLDCLATIAPSLGLELAVAHVDHALRPDSARDAAFCARLASRYALPFCHRRLTIRPGASVQNQARAQRYAALTAAARDVGATHVATAHHADDAAETALLQLARGSNLSAVVGLRAATPLDELTVIRPLLTVSRAQLEAYAAARGLQWVEDPSNALDDYERNRLRHHVVPALTSGAHGATGLHRTLEHLRDDADALDALATDLLARARRAAPLVGAVALDRQTLATAPRAVAARGLLYAHRGFTHATVTALLDALAEPPPHSPGNERPGNERPANERPGAERLSLHGATATLRPDRLVLEPTMGRGARELDRRRARPAVIDLGATPCGTLPWFEWTIAWEVVDRDGATLPSSIATPDPALALFDADRLPAHLFVAGPVPGAKLRVSRRDAGHDEHQDARPSHKRLKDLLTEAAVPRDARWRWPCLFAAPASSAESSRAHACFIFTGEDGPGEDGPNEDGGRGAEAPELLWVGGIRRTSRLEPGATTARVLVIRMTPGVSPKTQGL